MKILILFLTFGIVEVRGSSENWVPAFLNEVVIQTEEAGYKFTVKLDKQKKLNSISGLWNGVAFSIPEGELLGISDVILRHAGVRVDSPVPGGKQDLVMLVLLYGRTSTIDGNGETIYVPNIVRFHFRRGIYHSFEKAEAAGDNKDKWLFTSKEVDKEKTSSGFKNGKFNPYLNVDEYQDYP